MSLAILCQQSLLLCTLFQSVSVSREFVLHGMFTAGDDLPARAGFKVDDDWRFQIEREGFAVLSNNHNNLCLTNVVDG